jgi:GNAT superfamily N-acetyltransferase
MAVEVRIVTTRKDLTRFVKFPFALYEACPNWVPPLIKDERSTLRVDRNPAFEFCESRYWLALREGKVVGRIAGIINEKYIVKWNARYARFGWIDFVDDHEASTSLLYAVEQWARDKGMRGIHGPMGFTNLDSAGMLIEGFEEIGSSMDTYNYEYYPRHLVDNGYGKDTDWVGYELTVPREIPAKVIRVGQLSLKRGDLTLVQAKRPKELLPYANQIFDLLDEAYAHLYGTVELTRKQVDAYIKQYFSYIDPRFSKVVVDCDGKLIAFGLAFPSLSVPLQKARGRLFPFGMFHLLHALKHPTKIDLALVAVRPEYQGRGIPAIMLAEVNKACIEAGVVSAEAGRELEDNMPVQSLWKSYNARQHKRRRAYVKVLT